MPKSEQNVCSKCPKFELDLFELSMVRLSALFGYRTFGFRHTLYFNCFWLFFRFDWTGAAHQKTFRDMEEEFGSLPPEFLLQRCFELCTATADPTAPPVRSLFCRTATSQSANAVVKKRPILTRPTQIGNYLQNIEKLSMGFSTPGRIWHEKYLSRQLKYLRRTLGHLSAVYCLVFDRTGQMVIIWII